MVAAVLLNQLQIHIFAFLLINIMRGQLCQHLVRLVVHTCFCFNNRKKCNAEATALSNQSHVPVSAFPLEKIVTRGQLCQQLVRLHVLVFALPIVKKRNTPQGQLCQQLIKLHLSIFAFPLVQIVTRGQLCQQLVKSVACTCFCFSAFKKT